MMFVAFSSHRQLNSDDFLHRFLFGYIEDERYNT